MSFAARISHTPTGLALTFAEPLSRLDMAPDVAQHLASLLAVEARHRMRGVVAGLNPVRAENSRESQAPHGGASRNEGISYARHGGARLNDGISCPPRSGAPVAVAENKPKRVVVAVENGLNGTHPTGVEQTHCLQCECAACMHGETPLNGDHHAR